MSEEKTQIADGVASELNAELEAYKCCDKMQEMNDE